MNKFNIVFSLFISVFSLYAFSQPDAISRASDCQKHLYRNVSIPETLSKSFELSLSSAEAVREYKKLFQYLVGLFDYMPDSSAWPGKNFMVEPLLEVQLYSPEDGAGPWNKSLNAIFLKSSKLLDPKTRDIVVRTLREDYRINNSYLTEDNSVSALNILPRDAQVQLLRLKTRTALFLEALQDKDPEEKTELAFRFQNLKQFIELEKAIPKEFWELKYDTLAKGFIEATFETGGHRHWGSLSHIPGQEKFTYARSRYPKLEYQEEGFVVPPPANEKSIFEFESLIYIEPRFKYASGYSEGPSALYQEHENALLEEYRALEFETYSTAPYKIDFSHSLKNEIYRKFVRVEGKILYTHGTGWIVDKPVFVDIQRDSLPTEIKDEDTFEIKKIYPKNPKTVRTQVLKWINNNPMLVFVRPVTPQ